ncbi:MAG: hypothetical protein ABW000_25010 [Actinoplanes sp.]
MEAEDPPVWLADDVAMERHPGISVKASLALSAVAGPVRVTQRSMVVPFQLRHRWSSHQRTVMVEIPSGSRIAVRAPGASRLSGGRGIVNKSRALA